MMALASSGFFVTRYPDHLVSQGLKQLVARLLA